MANKKKHLKEEERFLIEKCLKAGDTYREIARRVERGLSTIADEITANGGRAGYDATKAHRRAYLKQYRKKRSCMVVALDPFLARFIEEKLRLYWSPERIAGYLKKNHKPLASAKAIRKFAHSRCLESFLYRKGRDHRKKYDLAARWQEERVFVDDSRCVREGFGHWEGDFIVSSKSSSVLLVLVERMTRDTILRWLPNRTNTLVRDEIVAAMQGKRVRSLTLDNDVAFMHHALLAQALDTIVYFARPYRSTDKALVENTNRWIRWFIPKKTDLATISKERILTIEEWFNSVPRQCLDFATSREMVLLQN